MKNETYDNFYYYTVHKFKRPFLKVMFPVL